MEKKTNTPALRFRGFDGPWEKKKLDDISMAFNYGLNAAATNYDGRHKYLRITDIDDESRQFIMDNVTSPSINFAVAEEYKLQEGDIVFARTGASVGKTYLYDPLDGDVYYAGYLIRAHIKPEYDPNFVFQNTLTQSYARYIAITSQRSGQPGVNAQEYSAYEIQVPSLAEQCCVGTTLQKLDNVIAKQAQKIKKLEQFRQAMLTKLFPREGAAEPELRFRGFSGAWKKRKVKDILIERNEQAPKSEEYPLKAFIANEGIVDKGKRYDRSALVTDTEAKLYKKTQYGDFIYSSNNLETGSIGLNKYGNASISPVYSIFYPTELGVSDFIGYRLVRKDFIREMVKWRQGVIYGQWRIPESDFLNIDILVPSIEEQRKIGSFFRELDDFISLQQKKLERMQRLKAALLEKLFV